MIRSRDIDNGRFAFSTQQSLAVLALYFIGYTLGLGLFAKVFTMVIFGIDDAIHPTVMLVGLLILFFSTVYVVREPIRASFRFFKRGLKANLRSVFTNFGLLWLFSIVCNMVLMLLLGDQTAENQINVENGIKSAPALYAFMVMVFAPMIEEFVFRGVLYQKFRSKTAFRSAILISTLVFGMIHVFPAFVMSGEWSELLFLFQYAGMSFFMIRCFEETSSIWGSISIHFLNNVMGFLVVFLS